MQKVVDTYQNLILALEQELKIAESNNDTREIIKISYDLLTVSKSYKLVLAEFNVKVDLKNKVIKAIEEDNMREVIKVAKELGITQADISRALNINQGNLSSCIKGLNNRLSKKNRVKIYNYMLGMLGVLVDEQ